MSSHFLRIGVSFTAICIVYAIYALVAVPMIEPQVKLVEGPETPIGPRKPSLSELSRRELLERLFTDKDWELASPMVLETDQGMLLFQDYQPLPDNRLEVKPFTLVFLAGGGYSDDQKWEGRPVIMQAPDGAILQSDQPIDLASGSMGRLTEGSLPGTVRIHSPQTRPGAGDDLEINTHDIRFDPQRVLAPHEVQFRMGRSFGQGRRLSIQLKPSRRPASGRGPTIAGVQSLELTHVDKLHLHVKQRSTSGGLLAQPDAKRGGPIEFSEDEFSSPSPVGDENTQKSAAPLEIACRGPFRFDFDRQVASFRDHVDVVQLHEEGPSDQLNCQLLQIFFARRIKTLDKSDKPTEPGSLDLRRLVATGSPVVVRANSRGAIAWCQQLEYDAKKERFSLIDDRQVIVESEKHPVRKVWGKQIHFRPHLHNRVISILGGAGVAMADNGRFTAEEMHLWLLETDQDKDNAAGQQTNGKKKVLPDRMLAMGDVQLDSPRLSGRTNRLEAWFRHDLAAGSSAPAEASSQPGVSDALGGSPTTGVRDDPRKQLVRKFDIHGQLVRVQLMQRHYDDGDNAISVDDITVQGEVQFTETQMLQPGQLPLTIQGDMLQVQKANALQAAMRVVGKPAQVSARGLKMSGANVNLSRGQNRLWIEGDGMMILPVRGNFLGSPGQSSVVTRPGDKTTQKAEITWKEGMEFDGRTVRFRRGVKIVGRHQLALAELVAVTLDRGVDFADPQPAGKVQARHIHLGGGVYMENHGYEGQRRISFDQMQVRSLDIDQQTGRLHSNGPGWVATVRYGDSLQSAAAAQPAQPEAKKAGLIYLHTQFQKEIVGNIHKRELQFVDRVRSVYGPINNWDQKLSGDRRGGLGSKGILLNCDRLAVAEMGPRRVNGHGAIELVASGNTWIESQTFTARAQRVSYTQAKDLLTLEGDGRSNAEIWHQKHPGAPSDHAEARKIWFWRRDGRVDVDNARYIDLGRIGIAPPPTTSRPPQRR